MNRTCVLLAVAALAALPPPAWRLLRGRRRSPCRARSARRRRSPSRRRGPPSCSLRSAATPRARRRRRPSSSRWDPTASPAPRSRSRSRPASSPRTRRTTSPWRLHPRRRHDHRPQPLDGRPRHGGRQPRRARGLTGSTGQHVFGLAGNVRGDVAVVTGRRLAPPHALPAPRRRHDVHRQAAHQRQQPRDATVALGPKGDVLVAWEDNHVIFARHIGPSNHAGAAHRIGDGMQSHLQAAVDDKGRLEVAWRPSASTRASPTRRPSCASRPPRRATASARSARSRRSTRAASSGRPAFA